ncbi:TetR/AcrR family transcriptional regulator [Nitrospirillum sp. BR 11164]|uniref:TetR/AcrR family transcriptional regulator n=1 Tax=Nitrospirillum sp. BR 11164 TaxID=3104324 RepID=UPI002B002247|nr:TetR/AcrR family transcriptional regulator [Nitrospirillum sp. BR 11164]MEA1651164.1 TetR/AcrR family transcriptional regulator [Nitrospirillum sp. BR 11164]
MKPGPQREPVQSRSKASYERMLAAAQELLKIHGNDEFTLTDVSRVGKVSVGSIYCRFDSKDDLIRVVQERVQTDIQHEQRQLIARVALETSNLYDLVAALTAGMAEHLRHHADILRAMMLRANHDPVVARLGKMSHQAAIGDIKLAVLRYRDAIAHPDPERAVQAGFNIMYSALARVLGLGSNREQGDAWEWEQLKRDLTHSFAAYLMTEPRVAKAVAPDGGWPGLPAEPEPQGDIQPGTEAVAPLPQRKPRGRPSTRAKAG